MGKDDNLRFIQDKIQEFKMAMFRAEMDSELQLPNNIIATFKTDDDGNVWFFTSCKDAYTTQFDKDFFAHLQYYRKGQDSCLKLNGRASIVKEEDADSADADANSGTGNVGIVLIKFKILHAEYCENKQATFSSVKEKFKTFFNDLFIPGSHRIYDFT
ncbi:pyridoxamine 5'-phosphate oxidase family protein [Ferruginibacter paludis]|uniref:pyridoxamine 5'-phosphate oxidase family protein n=1 Tax=Ferruginibacter paludis TaxID=1310417 RepID=UPI0025B574BA|nr:pyridoxamine 5'-phosphate oxidase family protein [Ferruginibacter paludis]MDN3654417.1 pyridoxamine 5'-phosphate oxidase family protein [Ferruginibacter paludis]